MVMFMEQSVDIFERPILYKLEFDLDIEKWASIDDEIKTLVSSGWNSIKYLNDDGTAINDDIRSVPDDCGGIYLFLVKPDKIPQMHRYIMYIGRAHRATNFSLRKRCVKYISDTRPKVARMMHRWGKDLYLFYLPINNTDDYIDKVESELLRVIIPPCNTRIPGYYVMPDEDMF